MWIGWGLRAGIGVISCECFGAGDGFQAAVLDWLMPALMEMPKAA